MAVLGSGDLVYLAEGYGQEAVEASLQYHNTNLTADVAKNIVVLAISIGITLAMDVDVDVVAVRGKC